MEFITILFLCTGIWILYKGYINRFTIIQKIIKLILPYIKNSDISEAQVKEDIIKIIYMYNGTQYRVYLPYKKLRRSVTKYYLVSNENKEEDITQQNGIKYYVNANDLGGTKIITKIFDEISREFTENEIPQ